MREYPEPSNGNLESKVTNSNGEINEERIEGTVKKFTEEKGYGFIYHPKGDVFVHYSVIEEHGYRRLMKGEKVYYTRIKTEKGWSAREIKRTYKDKDGKILDKKNLKLNTPYQE